MSEEPPLPPDDEDKSLFEKIFDIDPGFEIEQPFVGDKDESVLKDVGVLPDDREDGPDPFAIISPFFQIGGMIGFALFLFLLGKGLSSLKSFSNEEEE